MKNLSAIIWLFAANSVSGVAQGISMIAIPWYFAQQEQTRIYGIVYLLINITALVWGPLSGTFVDKYNRKHLFLVISGVSSCILFAIAAMGFYLGALPWYLVAAVFAMTFFNYNIHYPSLYAFVQEITEQKYYGKVASYIEVQGQITTMLAGAAGALLLEGATGGLVSLPLVGEFSFPFAFEKWEIHEIFLLDAVTYVIAIFLLLMIRFEPMKARTREKGPVLEQLKTGLRFLQDNPLLFLFGVASYAIFVALLLTVFYLGAIYVTNHLQEGADVYATMEITYAVGALAAGFFANKVFSRFSKVDGILFMMFAATALYLTLAFTNSTPIFYLMMVVLGLTNAGTRILRINYLFDRVPNQYFGRAGSIFFLTNIIFRILLLQLFWIPFFHEGNHVIYTFLILAIFIFLSALVLLLYRKRLLHQ